MMSITIPTRIHQRLFMFNVGHGDSVLICDDNYHSLLVDIGTQTPREYAHVPHQIENLTYPRECGLIISHYHWDHYGLFRYFRHPSVLFSNVYFPDFEMGGPFNTLGLAMMEFLKTAISFEFGNYRILPEIIANTNLSVKFCRKGTIINEITPPLRVFWPDFSHTSLRSSNIVNAAEKVRGNIEPIMDQYGIKKPPNSGKNYSMRSFFQDLEREEVAYRQQPKSEKTKVHKKLAKIEKDLSPVANILSIAFRTKNWSFPRFLFLGDIESSVLDKIYIPNSRNYDFLKASHHGTEFGSSLENLNTEFMMISRVEKSKHLSGIHDGYINRVHYRMLLSTSYLGDCFFV